MPDGTLSNVAKIRGRKKVFSTFVELMKIKGDKIDKYKAYIIHSDCMDEAEKLKKVLNDNFKDLDVEIVMIGPVIATHSGPSTLGVIFHAKER